MKRIEDRIILVTGATDGIGKLTAHDLARLGATVLVHGRDPARVRTTVDAIRAATGNDKATGYTADFASLGAVRQLAEQLNGDYAGLDVLVNNAGIGSGGSDNTHRTLSQDGHELRFAINYLAPFLLTHLLLPSLQRAAPARIVNVASAGQQAIDFDDVMLVRGFDGHRAYRQSKLALVMFTFELADRLKGGDVTVNCLHPGSLLDTKMVREGFGQPWGEPQSGADAEVYLATSPAVEGLTGQYFDQQAEANAKAQAYDQSARRQLWQLSERLTSG